MRDRKYYERRFEHYPDLVNLEQFREMLGGIGDTTARKLMRQNRVQHFFIRTTYLIPKASVIDYVLGEHYAEYKYSLKYRI